MADRVGQQLGNYRLVHLLGAGGFAEVYLAEQVYLKTFAAIKVLHTRLAQESTFPHSNRASFLCPVAVRRNMKELFALSFAKSPSTTTRNHRNSTEEKEARALMHTP